MTCGHCGPASLKTRFLRPEPCRRCKNSIYGDLSRSDSQYAICRVETRTGTLLIEVCAYPFLNKNPDFSRHLYPTILLLSQNDSLIFPYFFRFSKIICPARILDDFHLDDKKNIFSSGHFHQFGGCKFFYSGLLIAGSNAERLDCLSPPSGGRNKILSKVWIPAQQTAAEAAPTAGITGQEEISGKMEKSRLRT